MGGGGGLKPPQPPTLPALFRDGSPTSILYGPCVRPQKTQFVKVVFVGLLVASRLSVLSDNTV